MYKHKILILTKNFGLPEIYTIHFLIMMFPLVLRILSIMISLTQFLNGHKWYDCMF